MRKEGKRQREREREGEKESGQVDAEGVILLPLCFTVVVGMLWFFLRFGCCLLGRNMKWTRMENLILLWALLTKSAKKKKIYFKKILT